MIAIPDSSSAAVGSVYRNPTPFWIRLAFWICTVIAVAVVIRRLIALAHPTPPGLSQAAVLDQAFASHAILTISHILPALAFVLLTPFALLRRFKQYAWPERLLFPLGIIVGITAYAMSVDAAGGWTERAAVLFFNTLFLFSLVRAWHYKRQGRDALNRRWFTRAIAILLGISTTRPVMAVFFATSRITHLGLHQFFGIAFWIGFSINWIIVEVWLHFGDRQKEL